jgi:hypothetical protein
MADAQSVGGELVEQVAQGGVAIRAELFRRTNALVHLRGDLEKQCTEAVALGHLALAAGWYALWVYLQNCLERWQATDKVNEYLASTARGEKWNKKSAEGALVFKALSQYYFRLSLGGTLRTGQQIEKEMAAKVEDREWMTSLEWNKAEAKAATFASQHKSVLGVMALLTTNGAAGRGCAAKLLTDNTTMEQFKKWGSRFKVVGNGEHFCTGLPVP